MLNLCSLLVLLYISATIVQSQDIIGCGGFIKSEVEINFSVIEVKLYTKQGSLKYQTDCAPNNGYYMLPVYDKGDYVLKVEPPPGWTFEPQSVELTIDGKNDKCSKGEDINFVFTGFGVIGKVVSRGQTTGPEGVKLVLKRSINQPTALQTTTTSVGGDFVFEKVLPGDYVIEASRDPWLFDASSTAVHVDRETGNAGSSITVSGYNVQGRVFSDGEPVKGVHFVLFVHEDSPIPLVTGCDSSPLKDSPAVPDHIYVCHITSGTDGLFHILSVPTGKYILVPFYKGEYIKFDVVPSQLPLTVGHKSVVIQEAFHVTGFSVSGRVRTSLQGPGVAAANVIIDGRLQAVTQDSGLYHLDSMKSGTYHVSIEAPRMVFDVTTVKVTPNTPQLPDMVASKFEVCGAIEMEPLVVQSRRINIVDSTGQQQTTVALTDGTFCYMCRPGNYHFSVELSETDVKVGLKLTPTSKQVSVVDKPIDGIRFTQYRATVAGSVRCLDASCGPLQLSLHAITRSEEQRLARTEEKDQKSSFKFVGIVPGKYRVSVLNELWCWKSKTIDIEVVDKDLLAVDFIQTGFMLSASLSHSITLNFSLDGNQDSVGGSFSLSKGVNKFCLAEPGVYQLTPISCHQFEQDVYTYDTSTPSMLSLVATRHLVEGIINASQPQSDILVTVRSGESETVIGPLAAGDIANSDKHKTSTSTKASRTYKFSYWAGSGEKLVISAKSSVLLFYPPSIEVTVVADQCMGVAATFEGRVGVFIEGQIEPPLDDVLITISNSEGAVVADIASDLKGQYRVGPLDSLLQYSVVAGKEGYVFTAIDGKPLGHFRSFKLGRISVKVTDGSAVLPGVLLSLSGGSNYRRNNVTQDTGLMDFTSLSPGEYYLRVMMKEYQFEPASQMVQVGEGDTVQIDVTGKRVEYSCYGTVSSLNGEPEAGVFVESVSVNIEGQSKCRSVQEESKTELDGTFRIRGLQPGCSYEIRLKSGEVNAHIERSMPRSKHIQVSADDVVGVNIIVFRRMTQMDISGNVECNATADYINTLKVFLYKESSQDSPVHTAALGPTPFFYLPSVPINGQSYVLKLTSSLSRNTYDFSLPEVHFTATTSHRHFTLKFHPQRKIVDQELTHTSLFVLPLTILVIFLGYNYQKLLPWLTEYSSAVQMFMNRPPSSPSSSRQSTPPASEPVSAVSQAVTDLGSLDIAKKKPKAKKI